MITKLTAPNCHWGECRFSKKEMELINEGPEFWMFAHGCGTTRAVIKPSTREKVMYTKYQSDVEEIKRRQKIVDGFRKEYSLPSKGIIL